MNVKCFDSMALSVRLEAFRMAMGDMQESFTRMEPRNLETVVDFVASGNVVLIIWDSIKNELTAP